jgi:hypothetical protein
MNAPHSRLPAHGSLGRALRRFPSQIRHANPPQRRGANRLCTESRRSGAPRRDCLGLYDLTAITVSGVIARKEENVSLYTTVPLADEPYVERALVLHVRYTPNGSPEII